jgi:hypothetical protein
MLKTFTLPKENFFRHRPIIYILLRVFNARWSFIHKVAFKKEENNHETITDRSVSMRNKLDTGVTQEFIDLSWLSGLD